ncbi:MAG: DinB family protein [Bryobacter sp.]|nr:DinB family protein [Bryobacter sp.]
MTFLATSLALLERTPAVLRATLAGLPNEWLHADEGAGTWSPYVVMGHLIHGERTDWMPRVRHLLAHGETLPFPPFDREAQLQEKADRPVEALLDEFAGLREQSLEQLRALDFAEADLERPGLHPALGPVTLRQLLATWTSHDQAHLVQIHRVFARRYEREVGPWAQYLSVMRR